MREVELERVKDELERSEVELGRGRDELEGSEVN